MTDKEFDTQSDCDSGWLAGYQMDKEFDTRPDSDSGCSTGSQSVKLSKVFDTLSIICFDFATCNCCGIRNGNWSCVACGTNIGNM